MITIVDYGMGNLSSVFNMLKKIGVPAEISSDTEVIKKAAKIILPGVGAFDNAMENINRLGLLPILNKKAKEEKIPILGICLGMQLLTLKSEEGKLKGLGWIDAETKKFDFPQPNNNKVPHMGWNIAKICQSNTIFKEMDIEESRFYFVHSYHVVCNNPDNILAKTFYGYDFTSSIYSENIYGTQFHPEKSHKFGMKLLENFAKL